MSRSELQSIDVTKLRVAAMLNQSSGSCDARSKDKLASILLDAGISPTTIELVEGKDVAATLKKILADGTELLIVLGGDGTIRTAAEHCVGSKTMLIPLPGGTMNMLPKALHGEAPWDEVLRRTLANPMIYDVGGGQVGGHRFFCAGIFGSPALWADVREAARESRWREAVSAARRAYHNTFSRKVRYRTGQEDGAVTALAVICPIVSSAVPSSTPQFDVAALGPQSLGDAIHLAWSALFAGWREDSNVTSTKADWVDISAGGRIPAVLDSERVMLPRRAAIRFETRLFAAVVAPKAP
jgi:diacylglycerol kinase family enzyme